MGKNGVRLVPGDEGYIEFTDPSVAIEAEVQRPEYNEGVICRHEGCVFHVPPRHCTKDGWRMSWVVDEDGVVTARCENREEEQKGALLTYRARPEKGKPEGEERDG